MNRLGVYYGVAGGVSSFSAFIILQKFIRTTDVQGFILIGTVIISSVICCCTGMLIKTRKGKNINEKK
ncbi:hypothetical protein [Clostridium gasigenes]|uniref:hypothetical protein n=1 Tax=Clostridium gasigenes TaxID=94869 RepID=UPI001C0CD9A5|nr:hypothetical protein [Clostridium gasigenes]MBU3106509.1 hypothetical protein [Clostridium gasigenes]